MAIPRGLFTNAGAGITTPGGSYTYFTGVSYPLYYAGSFFIDTGYDDPVLWTVGVQAAEVYGARVYAKTNSHSPAQAANTYLGKWNLKATPVWQSKHWVAPTSNAFQGRILIEVEAYLSEPVDTSNGAYQRIETVDWSLYRT